MKPATPEHHEQANRAAAESYRLADVAFPRPLRREFTYRVPDDWPSLPEVGVRVCASLGAREEYGFVVRSYHSEQLRDGLKPLTRPVDLGRRMPSDLLKLTQWIATYYHCAWGEALAAAAGPVGADVEDTWRALRPDWDAGGAPARRFTRLEQNVMQNLKTVRAITTATLRRKLDKSVRLEATLERLSQDRLIEKKWRVRIPAIPQRALFYGLHHLDDPDCPDDLRACFASHTGPIRFDDLCNAVSGGKEAIRELIEADRLDWDPLGRGEEVPGSEEVRREPDEEDLDPEQRAASARLGELLSAGTPATALLWGPTGSGKTAVYCAAIRRAWALGRQVLYLVPEIGLATQLIRRLEQTLGVRVAIWHSSLSISERYWISRLVAAGHYQIVIGARSAVFAPLPDLGLIIVDEEHADSFKQSEPAPRYHARDVAIVRARYNNAICILGSATPSTESYENTRTGKFELLRLTKRVLGRSLPHVELVDLRHRDVTPDERWLTNELRDALTATITAGRKAIVFLNRRGHSTVVACSACGYLEKCPSCGLTLTYHSRGRRFRCHLCAYATPATDKCPDCDSTDFTFRGVGTQKIESMLADLDAPVRLVRLDADVAAHRGAAEKILAGFSGDEYNLLIGTQMVTKGLDVAAVDLVGVIWADQQLSFADFRAEERTFQLLTQVAGRAGRGGDGSEPGRVIVQTFCPNHELVALAAAQDVEGFYERELPRRLELQYPPATRLILLAFTADDAAAADSLARKFAEFWKLVGQQAGILLGPAPAGVPRRQGRDLVHILLKTRKVQHVNGLIGQFQDAEAGLMRRSKVNLTVDVDPVSFL
jgi:primosomal protein N' (replication factor Y)